MNSIFKYRRFLFLFIILSFFLQNASQGIASLGIETHEPTNAHIAGVDLRCVFFGCRKPPERGDDEGYCQIAPNGANVYMWRNIPVFIFFDHAGVVKEVRLHQRNVSGGPIWSYPIESKRNTLVIIHDQNDVIQLPLSESLNWNIASYTSEDIPALEPGEVYYYEILTEEHLGEYEIEQYARYMRIQLLPESIGAKIREDLAEIQLNTEDEDDILDQAMFNYFYSEFENIAQQEFPRFVEAVGNYFLLDTAYQMLSLPFSMQEPYIRQIMEYCNRDDND